jgi:hypothetical protein
MSNDNCRMGTVAGDCCAPASRAPNNTRAAIDTAAHLAESDTRNLTGMLDVPFAEAVSRKIQMMRFTAADNY